MQFRNKKVFIVNASNQIKGGGKQVVESFLESLQYSSSIIVLAPRELRVPDGFITVRTSDKIFFRILLVSLLITIISLFNRTRVLTVFGPNPALFFCRYHIQGFAKPSLIYGIDSVETFYQRIKGKLQIFKFSQADLIWTESVDVGDKIKKILGIDTLVISNAIHQEFLEYMPVSRVRQEDVFNIGYIGANYSHKNFKILVSLVCQMKSLGISCCLYTTLKDEDFKDCEDLSSVKNLGSLSRKELVELYKKVDLVILPSKLECFSVTPLEAIYFRKDCIVGDYSFNRSVYKDWVDYVDVTDLKKIVEAVVYRFNKPRNNEELEYNAKAMLEAYPVSARNKKLKELLLDETDYSVSR